MRMFALVGLIGGNSYIVVLLFSLIRFLKQSEVLFKKDRG